MEKLYDRADIYDLLENDSRYEITKGHWQYLLKGKPVRSLLDVSIGSGNMTLPVLELGIDLYGSDLSETMLDRCAEKAAAKGYPVSLRCSDFREVSRHFTCQFDCVASTGNSLAYVTNEEVITALHQMDALVAPGGYLYFDLRNWDKIRRTKQRFYTYDPSFHGDTRVNLVQVWDHNPDGTIDFNLLFTFENENRIFQKEHFIEHYNPVSQRPLLEELRAMGYMDMEIRLVPAQWGAYTDEDDWYCVMARKQPKEREVL